MYLDLELSNLSPKTKLLARRKLMAKLTPFEIVKEANKRRAMLTTAYVLTLRTISESVKATATIDKQALDVLVAVARESESRLGISA